MALISWATNDCHPYVPDRSVSCQLVPSRAPLSLALQCNLLLLSIPKVPHGRSWNGASYAVLRLSNGTSRYVPFDISSLTVLTVAVAHIRQLAECTGMHWQRSLSDIILRWAMKANEHSHKFCPPPLIQR